MIASQCTGPNLSVPAYALAKPAGAPPAARARHVSTSLFTPLLSRPARVTMGKTRGLGAGRKLKTRRREQLWHDKEYCRAHLGSEWKKPFAGCSHSVRAQRPLTAGTPGTALPARAYGCGCACLRAARAARLRVLSALRLTEGHRAGEDVRARCARSRRTRCPPRGQPPLALRLLSASALAACNGREHRPGHPAAAGLPTQQRA